MSFLKLVVVVNFKGAISFAISRMWDCLANSFPEGALTRMSCLSTFVTSKRSSFATFQAQSRSPSTLGYNASRINWKLFRFVGERNLEPIAWRANPKPSSSYSIAITWLFTWTSPHVPFIAALSSSLLSDRSALIRCSQKSSLSRTSATSVYHLTNLIWTPPKTPTSEKTGVRCRVRFISFRDTFHFFKELQCRVDTEKNIAKLSGLQFSRIVIMVIGNGQNFEHWDALPILSRLS